MIKKEQNINQKYKKIISILLLLFCVALAVFIIVGLVCDSQSRAITYINSNGVVVKFQLTDNVTLQDDTIQKLSKKINVTSNHIRGQYGNLVRVTENKVMFKYVLNNETFYLSAIGKKIEKLKDEVYTSAKAYTSLYGANYLRSFRDDVNSGETYSNTTVTLLYDADLSGEEWTPIGLTLNVNFQGTFDGDNHTISNFKITKANVHQRYISPGNGLFGFVEKSATIKNLKVSGAKIVISNNDNNNTPYGYGILVGYFGNSLVSNYKKDVTANFYETLTIKNCIIIDSSISISNGLSTKKRAWPMGIGGLIGSARLTVGIDHCFVDVNISAYGEFGTTYNSKNKTAFGGIMGAQIMDYWGSIPKGLVKITNCIYTGDMRLNVTSCIWGSAAGILGTAHTTDYAREGSYPRVIIENNYVYMDFSVDHMSTHPICVGNNGQYQSSGYSNYFYYVKKCSSYNQQYIPYFNISMQNNYFALRSNNTAYNASSIFKKYVTMCYADNTANSTTFNLSYDGKHRDKYDRGWIYNTTDTENLLYQQPTSNDRVAVEAPQQVDPNTFQIIT